MARKVVYVGRNIAMEYEGDLKGFAQIAMSPKLLAVCMTVAETKAKPIAIAISPRESGLYARSWKVEPGEVVITNTVGPLRRVCAKLINTAPHSALVEWGGKPGGGRFKGRYRPPQHVLQLVRDLLSGNAVPGE